MTTIASIDIGTTNIKINLFDNVLKVIDTVCIQHQNNIINDQVFEMDFEEIWKNVLEGLNQFIKKYYLQELEIILTTAMHSVQLMDNQYRLIGNVVTWADKRGHTALDAMTAEQKESQYYRSGTPMHAMNPFIKLNEIYKDELLVGSLKDILFYRLSGEWAIDVSNASSSGMFNIKKSQWDRSSLESIGIELSSLPIIQPIDYSLPVIDDLVDCKATVIIGTSDGISSNYVFNNISNVAVLSVGTSHAIRVVHNEPLLNPEIQNFSYMIDNTHYLVGLPSNNGADILSWLVDVFNASYDELNELAVKRPETHSIFHPYLNGERAPIWNEDATASLMHLSRESTRESVLFSMILGMMFNIKENVIHLSELVEFEVIGLVGGITKLSDFPQLLADVLGYQLYIPSMTNAETMGSLNASKNLISKGKYQVIRPNKVETTKFNRLFELYKSMSSLE